MRLLSLASVLVLGSGWATNAYAAHARLIDQFTSGGYSPYYGVATTDDAIYGVTSAGNTQNDACGTVFQLVGRHGQWTPSTLHSFSCGKGSGEAGPLSVDSSDGDVWGYLYSGSFGAVFRLSKPAKGKNWTYDTIYQFQGGADGNLNAVYAPLLLQGGTAFGVAALSENNGGAEFFSLTDTGSGWQKTSLATIATGNATALVGFDANGAAYISTSETGGIGAVYQVTPQGGGTWTVTRIAHFKSPRSESGVTSLVLGADGTVFGLVSRGFKNVVFELTPPSGGGMTWTRSIIADPSKHGYGLSSLALGFGGNLVGVLYGDQDFYGGAAFTISPPAQGSGSWTSTLLWDFGARGPDTNPISINTGPYGLYYGTLNNTYDNGAVYQLRP